MPNTQLEITEKDATLATLPEVIEQTLVSGNLAGLSTEQRLEFYKRTCESLGLNPLTKPFEYISLNGKLVLYARKDCTEQLRKLRGVSVDKLEHQYNPEMGVYVVTAIGHDKDGRRDSSTGAVPFPATLKGEAAANAVMKAETKAKRRLTLSICGLGMLDETEIESIPDKALPMGSCVHCGKPIPPEQVACGCKPHTVPQLNAKPEPKPADPKPIDGDKEKLLQDFLAALTQAFPASEVRQRVGQEILGCKTMQEMRRMSINKLRLCAEQLVELGERLKKEPTTNADDICALVNLIQEDAR